MSVVWHKVRKEDLTKGDHIYSWRVGKIYAHHGIYEGEGKVIHFTTAIGQKTGIRIFSSSSSFTPKAPCNKCDIRSNLCAVTRSCIDCFLSGGNLYIFEYEVLGKLFVAKSRGGTCSTAKSDPASDVLHRARYLLQHGFGEYDLVKNNCEDFASYCKTGLLVDGSLNRGHSGQVGSFRAASNAVKYHFRRFFGAAHGMSDACFALINLCGAFGAIRVDSDIGMRPDMVKVAVEDIGIRRKEM